MHFSNGVLDTLVELIACFGCAEPFLGGFDLSLPPIRTGYGARNLHACSEPSRDEGLCNLLCSLFRVNSCHYLDTFSHDFLAFLEILPICFLRNDTNSGCHMSLQSTRKCKAKRTTFPFYTTALYPDPTSHILHKPLTDIKPQSNPASRSISICQSRKLLEERR